MEGTHSHISASPHGSHKGRVHFCTSLPKMVADCFLQYLPILDLSYSSPQSCSIGGEWTQYQSITQPPFLSDHMIVRSHEKKLKDSSATFTFTGKERDEETGYTYHGARYFDAALLTSWMAVDPMSDKYPSLSPYNYCAWNPVKLVDPDGAEAVDDWVKKSDGTIYWDPKATSQSSTKKGETYLGKKGATYDSQTNEVTLYRQNGTISKYQTNGPMTDGDYTYPIDKKSDTYNSHNTNRSACYGSFRANNRKHAGCDLYAPEGTAVFSIAPGTVMSVGNFYKGTDEVAVNHNSFIGRYCELIPSFDIRPGCKVNSGDFLGVIVSMNINNGGNNSMLHFEMYSGNASGPLTSRSNPPFQRRVDLKNPTPFLNNILGRTWF